MIATERFGDKQTIRLAILVSGAGSNAEKLLERFEGRADIRVALVVCNKPEAPVTAIARRYVVPVCTPSRDVFYGAPGILPELEAHGVTHLVMAGFLWLVPPYLIQRYPGRILNLHPSLLPKFGGQGMYGMRVHEAVIAAGETQSGITIHEVNERFDEGKILFQATCAVSPGETAESLSVKIRELEHRWFPEIVERIVLAR